MLDLIPNSIIKPLLMLLILLILWIVNVINLRRHLLKAKLVSIHLQEHVLCAMVAANRLPLLNGWVDNTIGPLNGNVLHLTRFVYAVLPDDWDLLHLLLQDL